MNRETSWTSAIAPEHPPIPKDWHWMAGLGVAALILVATALGFAERAIPDAGEDVEAMVVSLGGGARTLEPPPPGVETTDQPSVPAERAEDAPPPTAPPQPRALPSFSASDGRPSSGTGAGRIPSPPPAARPPPPPPPARTTQLSRRFIDISQRAYMGRIVYPRDALSRQQQGTGILRVVIDRSGRVVEWQLVQSTGHRRLDAEIERVAREVRQLDPLPSDYAGNRAEARIPIIFFIEYPDDG
ncbi:energy transducer TonB [Parasphingopyxis sp.]|uniref:energy transducer TonB n=1 Tax=Parasphingopyxis sp. TaxID=1920299 RepID=UPI002635BF1B|nr:energy transducer TonB [Parasphingopyxis sp.]